MASGDHPRGFNDVMITKKKQKQSNQTDRNKRQTLGEQLSQCRDAKQCARKTPSVRPTTFELYDHQVLPVVTPVGGRGGSKGRYLLAELYLLKNGNPVPQLNMNYACMYNGGCYNCASDTDGMDRLQYQKMMSAFWLAIHAVTMHSVWNDRIH
ncbi:unnamed protein product [Albugo candida]|uniref:Uncharacterized protein n=1 Tax=Albugo candida TaxID=65357 RepID=A0A024GP26_9STRA|nr:unnamed protein product [Albugo candida]|eukprot:CCI48290.1 unnamed protein product [Albugo candida]